MTKRLPFKYFKTSPEIIRLAVMLYVRFPLSLRNVEDLLHERGIDVSHETVRFWWNRFAMMILSCVGSTDATAQQNLSSGATVAQALGIAPPQRHTLQQTDCCRNQEYFDAALQQQINNAAESILELSRPAINATSGRQPGLAYYNTLTDEYYVGDRVFHRDDYNAALETMGRRNTEAPSGLGWRALDESAYIAYIRSVQGLDTPMDQTIYNNCVIARSRGASENVLREVRASCRETARNPSMIERWRWGG